MTTATLIKPELTAINTRNSKTAQMVVETFSNGVILDYGCGTGRNVNHILKNSDCSVIGQDIPEQMVRSKESHEKIIVEHGERVMFSESTEKNPEFFDGCINSHVLNVVEEKNVREQILKDIHEALVPQGLLFLEVRTKSDVESAKNKISYGDGYLITKGKNSYTFQKAFTKEELGDLVEGAGFTILEHVFNSSNHIIVAMK